jgi:hypothetical protein
MKLGVYICISQNSIFICHIQHALPSASSSNTGGLLEVLAPMVKSALTWTSNYIILQKHSSLFKTGPENLAGYLGKNKKK